MVGEYGMLILQMLMLMMELEQGGRGTQRGFEERSLMSSLTLTLTPPSTPLTQAPPHPQGLGVNFSFCLKCFVKVTFSDICSLIIRIRKQESRHIIFSSKEVVRLPTSQLPEGWFNKSDLSFSPNLQPLPPSSWPPLLNLGVRRGRR